MPSRTSASGACAYSNTAFRNAPDDGFRPRTILVPVTTRGALFGSRSGGSRTSTACSLSTVAPRTSDDSDKSPKRSRQRTTSTTRSDGPRARGAAWAGQVDGLVGERTMTEEGWILSSGLTPGVSILDPLPEVGSRVWVDEPVLLAERRYRVDRVYRCYSRRVSEASCAQSGSDSGLVTVVRVMVCVCVWCHACVDAYACH